MTSVEYIRTFAEFKAIMDGATAAGTKTPLPPFILFSLTREVFLTRFPKAKFYTANAPLVGILVSKKLGKAVVRNLCKRRLRAAITQSVQVNLLSRDLVYIFLARSQSGEIPMSELLSFIKKSALRARRGTQNAVPNPAVRGAKSAPRARYSGRA